MFTNKALSVLTSRQIPRSLLKCVWVIEHDGGPYLVIVYSVKDDYKWISHVSILIVRLIDEINGTSLPSPTI